jgi:putative chitinase
LKLTTEILVVGCGCTSEVAGAWLSALSDACDKFEVSKNPQRMASFLANVGVESTGLTKFEENLYYTDPKRLAVVWPTRFAIDSHMTVKMPNPDAFRYLKQPQALANFVYANRLGNGDVSSGDGWKYRGQGPIQLTGKTNIEAFFEAAGLPTDTDPATLQEPENGAASAAWFFQRAFAAADDANFDLTVKNVNGALPGPGNQGDLRRTRYAEVLPLLLASPSAPTPAVKVVPTAKKTTTPAVPPAAQDTP